MPRYVRQPVRQSARRVQPAQQVAVALDPLPAPRRSATAAGPGRRAPPRCAARRRSAARRPRSRVRRDRGLRRRCSGSSPGRPCRPRRLLVIVEVTSFGHRLFELLRHAFGQHRRAARAHRFGQRHIQVHSLAAAGDRKRGQPDVVHHLPHRARHLADLRASSRPRRDRGRTPAGCRARVLPASTNRHCGTCTSSAACWAIQASPSTRVDDRIGGGARAVRDALAVQPVAAPRTPVASRRTTARSTPLGQRLRVTGPTRDVRQHHLGDRRVVVENLAFGGGLLDPPVPGRAPCRRWSA